MGQETLEPVVQAGHSGDLAQLKVSPDGKYLATVASEGIAMIWDIATGERLRVLHGRDTSLKDVAWTPDGQAIVIGGDDAITVWNVTDGTLVRRFESSNYTDSLDLSSDGRYLLSGGSNYRALLWDFQTGKMIRELTGHENVITSIRFSRDQKLAVTASIDGTAMLWEVHSGKRIRTFDNPLNNEILNVAEFSPDSLTVALGSWDKTVTFWSTVTGEQIGTLAGHSGYVNDLLFAQDAKTLWTASNDSTVRLWDLQSKKTIRTLDAQSRVVSGLATTPDEKYLFTAEGKGVVRMWSTDTGQLIRTIGDASQYIDSTTFDKSFQRFANGYYEDPSVVWNLATGELERIIDAPTQKTHSSSALSRDAKYMAVSTYDENRVYVASSENGKALYSIKGFQESPAVIAFTPDSQQLVVCSYDGLIYQFDAQNGKSIRSFRGHSSACSDMSFSEDGKRLATCGWDGDGKVWELATGKLLQTVQFGKTFLNHVALSPDGTTFAVVYPEDTVQWIRVSDAKRLGQFVKTKHSIDCLAFSPSGEQLLVGYMDHTASVWDVSSERVVQTLRGHTTRVTDIATDGTFVFTSSGDGTNRIWDLATGNELIALYTFVDQREWLAITPDGYFDASVNGARFIRYRIPGTNHLIPLERFRSRFEVPGLLTKILAHENHRGENSSAVPLPPQVSLVDPATSRELDSHEVVIRAKASSRGSLPVTKLRVLVNQKPYSVNEGYFPIDDPKLGDVTAEWKIELPVGKHEVSVVAYNEMTFEISPSIELLNLGGGTAQEELPNLYVLAIGVSAYPEDPLEFAHRDAQALADAYAEHSRQLFKRVDTKVLINEQATREAILDALASLRKNMTQRDFGVFFFAGHGKKDARDKLYFMPVDGKKDRLSATAIDATIIQDEIVSSPGQILILLDACHAGAILSGTRHLTDNLIKDLSSEDKGVAVMCSATGREVAQESRTHQHGLFTLALLEAIRGQGGPELPIRRSPEGAIYFKQIDSYVTERVKQLSQGDQHPVTGFPRYFRDFPLSKPN